MAYARLANGALVRFADGMTQSQVSELVAQRGGLPSTQPQSDQATQDLATSQVSKQAIQGDFSRGVESGAKLLGADMYGLSALVGESIGSKELTDFGLAGYERKSNEAASIAPRVGSLQDINSVGDAFDAMQGWIGQSVPSLASSLTGAGVGSVVGRTVAKSAVKRMVEKGISESAATKAVERVLTDGAKNKLITSAMKRGALTGAYVTSAGQNQGSLFGSLKEDGVDDAAATAWGVGALQGALDVIPEVMIAKKLLPGQVEKELSKSLTRGILKGVGKQTAAEGATEGAQQALSSFARISAGEDEDWNHEDTIGLLDSIAAGSVVGALVGGSASTVERLRAGSKAKAQVQTPGQEAAAGAAADGLAGSPPAGAAQPGDVAPAAQTGNVSDIQPNVDTSAQPVQKTPENVQVAPATGQPNASVTPPVGVSTSPGNQPLESGAVSDVPTAEPINDLVAQLRDTRNPKNPRRGTYLSIANLDAHPNLIEDSGKGLARIPNADGAGGVLLAKPADANEYMRRKKAGEDLNALLGEYTLSGGGKPQTDNAAAVQQKDKSGAVTAETLVDGNDLAAVEAARQGMQLPGRTVEATSPQAVITRREHLVAAQARAEALEEDRATQHEAGPWAGASREHVFAEDAVDDWADENQSPNDFDTAKLGDYESVTPTGFYGMNDQLHGSRVPGKGTIADQPVSARAYTGETAQAKATEAALRLSASDPDTTYVPHAVRTPDEARRAGLSAPGWYVAAHRRTDTETFGPDRRSRAQTIRLAVTRAKRAWQNLSREQKHPQPGEPVWGIEMVLLDQDGRPQLDENGDYKTAHLASKEVVYLGRALSADTKATNATALVDALHDGIGALMSMEGTARMMPAAFIARQKVSSYTVLAEKGNKKLMLGQLSRSLEDTARASNLNATLFGKQVRDGKIDDTTILPPEERTEVDFEQYTLREKLAQQSTKKQLERLPEEQRRQQFAKSNLNTWGRASTDKSPGVPGFDTDRNPEVDKRNIGDTEAQQNAAMTTLRVSLNEGATRATGDSSRDGTSAIGSITAEHQPQKDQVAAPVVVNFGNNAARNTRWTNVLASLRDVFGVNHTLYMTDDVNALMTEATRDGAEPWLVKLAERQDVIESRKPGDALQASGFMFQHNNRTYIFIDPQISQRAGREGHLVKTILHEVGHAVTRQYVGSTPAATQPQLYEAFLAAQKRGDSTANRKDLSEVKQFEEWMSDQVAAWAARNDAPRNAVEQWFKGLADLLVRVWKHITSNYSLDATADKFIRDVVMNADRSVHPQLASLGGANDLMFDLYEPMISKAKGVLDVAKAWKAKHRTTGAMLDATAHAAKQIHETFVSRLNSRIHRMGIPAFSEIARMFHLNHGDKGGYVFNASVNSRIRNFTREYRKIADNFPKLDQDKVLQALQSETALEKIPDQKVRESVAQVRVFLRRLYDYQRAMNLPIAEVQNYFPQIGDAAELLMPDAVDTIHKAVQDAIAQMTPQQINDQEIITSRQDIETLVSNMTDDNFAIDFNPNAIVGDVGKNVKSPFSQAMMARRLSPAMRNIIRSVHDKDGKARFYSKSVDQVMHSYMSSAVRRAEFNMLLGDRTYNADTANAPEGQERIFDPLGRFHELLLQADKDGATAEQKEFMYSAMSAFMGNYNRIRDPGIRNVVKSVAFYQQLRTLLLTTLSSIPEFASIFVATGDFKNTWASVRAGAGDSFTKGSRTMDALRAYGWGVDELDSMNMNDIKDAADYDTKLTRVSEKFFQAIGLTKWTNWMRGMSLHASMDYITRHAASTDPDSVRRMEELGITPRDVGVWDANNRHAFGELGFTPEDIANGNTKLSEADLESIKKVTGAVTRMVNQMVVSPTASMKSLWRSDQRLSLVAQLGSFVYGHMTQVLGRVWYELNREGATTMQRAMPAIALAMMVPLAALGIELKEILQYDIWGQGNKSPYEKMSGLQYMKTVIGRSGVTGIAQMGFDAYETSSYGRSPFMATLGPTVSQFSAAMTDVAQSKHKLKSAWNQVILPGTPVLSSIPGIRNSLRADY